MLRFAVIHTASRYVLAQVKEVRHAVLLCIYFLHGSGASGRSGCLGHWVSRYVGIDPVGGGSVDCFGRHSHVGPLPKGGSEKRAHHQQLVEVGAKDQDHQEEAATVCLRGSLAELIGPQLHEEAKGNL